MPVVDPEVTQLKLDREIELWHENAATYRKRGWLLLERRGVEVDVGFLARLPLGPQSVPVMTACVRLDYTNYDLWAPSVEFIDPFSGQYASPPVPAVVPTEEGPRNLLVGSHPDTDRPFLCVPGVRQYHTHPQHMGDAWLLHRATREGSLATICDRLWQAMARCLIGLQVNMLTLPSQIQVELKLATGDIDALAAGAPGVGEAG